MIRNQRKDNDYSHNNISTNTFTNTSMNIRMNTSIGANTRNIGTSTDERTCNYGTDRGREIKNFNFLYIINHYFTLEIMSNLEDRLITRDPFRFLYLLSIIIFQI